MKQKPDRPSIQKQLQLLLLSCLLLLVFFALPQNRRWLTDKPFSYWTDFLRQKDRLGPEQRKRNRWGNNYIFSKRIAAFFEQKKIKEKVLVLLPPADYFKKHNVSYEVPEPAVFYYYTGLKTVWINSKNALKANWMVRAKSGSILIDSIRDKQAFADSIRALKKYKLPL